MSALPPKADIRQRIEHVCFVHERTFIEGIGGALLPRPLNLLGVRKMRLLISLESSSDWRAMGSQAHAAN
jgi:hypothetical protein